MLVILHQGARGVGGGKKLVWRISLSSEESFQNAKCYCAKLSQNVRRRSEEMRVKGSHFWGTKISRREERKKDDCRRNSNSLMSSELGNGIKITKTTILYNNLHVRREMSICILLESKEVK